MQFKSPKRGIIPSMLLILVASTILELSLEYNQYAYSQTSNATSNASTSTTGVHLIDIHQSPANLKSGSKFEIFSTIVNNSPGIISFIAGSCESPLSALFASNVIIRHTQGCSSTSPPFKLNPGDKVSVAGPDSSTIYQAVTPGQTKAAVTFHYRTATGQDANVTKPFVFLIS